MMMIILLVEACMATVLAALAGLYLGYRLDQNMFKGLREVGGLTLIANAVTFTLVLPFYLLGYLPLEQLSLTWKFPAGYLGNIYVVLEIAVWTYALAGIVGYFMNKLMGTLILVVGTFVAALMCFAFSLVSSILYELPGDLMLLIAIVLYGALAPLILSRMTLKGKGQWPLRFMWFGFCIACGIGYWAAGQLGLLLITLPTLLIFVGFLYHLSRFTLPIRDDQRAQAFRSLITFILGTNYPYYVIRDWKKLNNCNEAKPEQRVKGDPYSQFFAGPGIVLNDSTHLAVITDGIKFWVAPPGVSFTGQFEFLYAEVDLRPQLRIKIIEAETKDGIGVKVLTFMPHRIGTGGRQPALGEPYPYDEEAVLKAVTKQAYVEHTWKRDEKQMATENVSRIMWDELVLMMGPPILKSIIVNYTCNELHAPGDPRVEIASEFRKQIKDAMAPLGIEMVGGGISNIVPPPDVVEQRIQNWEAKWKRRIEIELGEAEAEATRRLEPVWAEAQLEVMNELAEILMNAGRVADDTLALQLVDALRGPVESHELEEEPIAPEAVLVKRLLARRTRRSVLP